MLHSTKLELVYETDIVQDRLIHETKGNTIVMLHQYMGTGTNRWTIPVSSP